MSKEKTDVEESDLYAELKKTLESEESEETETSGASDEKQEEDDVASNSQDIDENEEMSEEEISKLSPRAQKRIRDLAEQVKTLAEKETKEVVAPQEKDEKPHSFKDVREFLDAVQDEPSRELLEKFYGVIKAENASILAPLEQKNNETKFETEFSQYERIEGLKDYKDSLKKTFLRDPSKSLKALVGEVVTDLQMNKVKPIENKQSTPNRGLVDTSKLSKDELYDMLDTLRD